MLNKTSNEIAIALLAASCFAGSATASEWSDTSIGYRHGTSYREPFNTSDISKNILSFTHASGYKYGMNFFNVDMLRSDSNDLASGGGGGAQEVYAVYRTTLSFSKVTGKPIKIGPLRDVSLTAGFDFNAKDDQFSPRVFKTAFGPKVSFDVPGFFDVAIVARTERNHNWYATGSGFGGAGCTASATVTCNPDVKFKSTAAIEAAWMIPFQAGLPAKFQGFLNHIGKKGNDGTGNATAAETLLEFSVMFDVGSVAGQKDTLYAGLGYQYWHNKFGSDSANDPTGGSDARVPQLQLEVHF